MNIGISWFHQTVVCIHGTLSQRTSDLLHSSTAWFVVKNLVFVLLTAIVAAALGEIKKSYEIELEAFCAPKRHEINKLVVKSRRKFTHSSTQSSWYQYCSLVECWKKLLKSFSESVHLEYNACLIDSLILVMTWTEQLSCCVPALHQHTMSSTHSVCVKLS